MSLESRSELNDYADLNFADNDPSEEISEADLRFFAKNVADSAIIKNEAGDVSASFEWVANVLSIVNDGISFDMVDGLQTALDAKLDASAYTAADVLTKIKTVDGPGSGLDADLLDGMSSAAFAAAGHGHVISDVTGLQTALDAKLPTASYTAADVLAKLLTVDGASSGLDADLLDGESSAAFHDVGNATGTLAAARIADASLSIAKTSGLQTTLDAKLPTASYTAADVLAKLLTVDGAGSGIDADLLDGLSSAAFATAAHTHTFASLTSKPTTISGYGITDLFTSIRDLGALDLEYLADAVHYGRYDFSNSVGTRGGYIGWGNGGTTLGLYGDNASILDLNGWATIQMDGALLGKAANFDIRQNTADGSDESALRLAGGGAVDAVSRGGYINLFGNDHAFLPGMIEIAAGSAGMVQIDGDVTLNGNVGVFGGLDVTGNAILDAALGVVGAAIFDSSVTAASFIGSGASAILAQSTADGSDNALSAIAGGGAALTTRGGSIVAYGNEHATFPGYVRLLAGTGGTVHLQGLVVVPAGSDFSVEGKFDGFLWGTKTWDPASALNNSTQTTTVTVTGAAAGDIACPTFSLWASGFVIQARVTGANTVTVYLTNITGGTSDLGSGTLNVMVFKAP